jgi:GTPase
MKPVVALVGRPNVGKSTLFNCLTRSRQALVADFAGLTRDRQYAEGKLGDRPWLVVDTGGITGERQGIVVAMERQVAMAIGEAETILFLVDGREGLCAADEAIATQLRSSGKPVLLVVNKTDGIDTDIALGDFHRLGLGEPIAIAAAHNRGIHPLVARIMAALPLAEAEPDENEGGIRIAIVGRPNVGKSTLVNRLLGEERVVVFDQPGTTRDSIYIPFERDGQRYTLIDTAGVRRRGRIEEAIEKFSIIKTLQAIDDAHVVIAVVDASEGVTEQDAHLIGLVVERGRALVLALNKWDGLSQDQKDETRRTLELKLPFTAFASHHIISALHGTGVGDLFPSVRDAYQAAMSKLSTPSLTRLLESLLFAHQPPLVKGRRIKLRYAHQGGKNPPIIVIHGNQVDQIPESYQRYLENGFRQHLDLEGTPVRVEFRGSDNPYAGKRNTLTPRQVKRKQRLMRYQRRN